MVRRDTYKSIYKQVSKIKSDISRRPRTDNVMIPIDILEKCLHEQLCAQSSKRNITKFIDQFTENFKSI